jgi:hypothetical protein
MHVPEKKTHLIIYNPVCPMLSLFSSGPLSLYNNSTEMRRLRRSCICYLACMLMSILTRLQWAELVYKGMGQLTYPSFCFLSTWQRTMFPSTAERVRDHIPILLVKMDPIYLSKLCVTTFVFYLIIYKCNYKKLAKKALGRNEQLVYDSDDVAPRCSFV